MLGLRPGGINMGLNHPRANAFSAHLLIPCRPLPGPYHKSRKGRSCRSIPAVHSECHYGLAAANRLELLMRESKSRVLPLTPSRRVPGE